MLQKKINSSSMVENVMTYWRRWIQREVLWHFQRWCCWCVHQTHDRHVSEPAQNSLKQQTRTSACGTTLYCVSSEYNHHLFFYLNLFMFCIPPKHNLSVSNYFNDSHEKEFPVDTTGTSVGTIFILYNSTRLLGVQLMSPSFFFSLSLYYNYRDWKSVNSTLLLSKNLSLILFNCHQLPTHILLNNYNI